jgi:hypothetical protein
MRSCHTFLLPTNISDAADLVDVELQQPDRSGTGVFQLRTSLYLCDRDLQFLSGMVESPYQCALATSHLLASSSCQSLWWGGASPRLCAPEGLKMANLGEMRARNEFVVMQVCCIYLLQIKLT